MSTPRAVDAFPPIPALLALPTARHALAAEARRIHVESVRYWSGYGAEAFFRRPAPEVWAPADQVRHLTRAVRAVNQGLLLPRPALLLLFGWSRRPSRSLEALAADYKAALAGGRGATRRFTPRAVEVAEQTAARRERIMANHGAAIQGFANALERWSGRAPDRYRLPHPLLGKLTVREMAYFTLLHNVHHVRVAERRRRGETEVA